MIALGRVKLMQHVLLEVHDWGDWTVCCRSPRRVELPLARQPGIDRPGLHNGQQLPCDVDYLSSWSPTRHWTRSAVWRERRSVDSAWSFMPWRSSTLMTCSNCAHLTMTSRTSSLMRAYLWRWRRVFWVTSLAQCQANTAEGWKLACYGGWVSQ